MFRWALLVLITLLLAAAVYGEPSGYTLAIGRLDPSPQESDECYFPIGQHASVNLHPRGDMCVIARMLTGRTGRLVFIPDEPQ